jgi:hypothetical protein
MDKSTQQDETNQMIESVYAFSKVLRRTPELAKQVHAASNPQEIVEIAKSIGIDLSIPMLRRLSGQLSAPYWPWYNQTSELRRKFFEGVADGGRGT